MLWKNIKISIRNLLREKLIGILGILGFAAGFSICLIIGLFVYNKLTADSYNKNYNEIFRIVNNETKRSLIDYKINDILVSTFPGIDKTCPVEIHPIKADVYTNNNSIYIEGLISTTNDFFNLFSIDILQSTSDNPFADKNSSVITKSTAKKIFGNNNPLGELLKIGSMETTVSAVIPDFPINSSIDGSILLNSENSDFRLNSNWVDGETFTTTSHYILLQKNQSYTELEKIINQTIGNYDSKIQSIFLQPLKDIYLNTSIIDKNKHGNKGFIKILSIIGIMILLLSVVNYINYIMSLQLKKHKEIGIRKTNGAKLSHLLSAYLTEVLLWISLALFISFLIVILTIPLFNELFLIQLQLKSLLSLPFVIGVILVLLIVVCLAYFPLVFLLSKFDVHSFLNGKTSKINKYKTNSLLTVFQLSVSILLIIGLFVVQKQVRYVKNKNIGFEENALLYIKIPYRALDHKVFKNELLKHPSIEKVCLSRGVPGDLSAKMTHPDWAYTLYMMDIDEDFLPTMEIELLKGRNLTFSDDNKNVCVVNEATLKALDFNDFAGKKVNGMDIIGVVKDFNYSSLHHKIQPILMKYGQGRDINIRFSSDNISSVMNYINKTWKDLGANAPLQYQFYDIWFDSMYKKEEQLSKACTIFAIIAFVITCMGLLGQTIQISINRTKEIGIRKVNGAKVSEILSLLNKDFIKWVAIAFVIAVPIAWYAMNKWLENFAYKTTLSWWIFALAGVLALGIALLTVSWQSWRAATRNPVEALRYE